MELYKSLEAEKMIRHYIVGLDGEETKESIENINCAAKNA